MNVPTHLSLNPVSAYFMREESPMFGLGFAELVVLSAFAVPLLRWLARLLF
jgi:hypothetical protein